MTLIKLATYFMTWHPIQRKKNWEKVRAMDDKQCLRFLLVATPIGCYFGLQIGLIYALTIISFVPAGETGQNPIVAWPFSVLLIANALIGIFILLRFVAPQIEAMMEPKKNQAAQNSN